MSASMMEEQEEYSENKFNFGGFDITATNERLILFRKFPETYLDIPYEEIKNLQHVTKLKWKSLVKSLIFFNAFVLLYLNNIGILFFQDVTEMIFPGWGERLPIPFIMISVWLLTMVYALTLLANFFMSFRGTFTIFRKTSNEIEIHTKLTKDVREFIEFVDEVMDAESETKDQDRYMPSIGEGGITSLFQGYWNKMLGVKTGEKTAKSKIKPIQKTTKELLAPLETVKERNVILISTKGEKHTKTSMVVMEKLVKKAKIGGVYLSFTKPSEYIISNLTEREINSDDIYFIDCVSCMAGKIPSEQKEKTAYIENPNALEDITLHMDSMLKRINSEKKFILLDSLSSLSIYNSEKSVKEFTHYLINKIRLHNLVGIILTIEKKETEELIRIITPMCDVRIDI